MNRLIKRVAFTQNCEMLNVMGEHYFRLRYAYAVLFALLALELAIGAVLDAAFGMTGHREWLLRWMGVVPVMVLWFVHVPIWSVISRKPEPTRWIFETYRKNLVWFAFVGLLLTLAYLKTFNVATIKTAIPIVRPFYADPFLIELDRAIFFTDPWRITHAMLHPWATPFLDRLYGIWQIAQLAFGSWMIFTRNLRLQLMGLMTYTFAWLILGGLTAMAFSSVGPVFYQHFYGDPYFEPLMANLADAPLLHHAMGYLLETNATGVIGSGISAFPSMHVALAVWEALIIRMAFRNRYATIAGFTWASLIFVGSIHLSWHYAVDGIFSAVCVVLIWKVSEKIVAYAPRSTRLRPADALAPTQEN